MGQVVSTGSSSNLSPLPSNNRWLYCPICDKTWKVDVREYCREEKQPNWLHEQCSHWNDHQFKEYLRY